MLQDNADVSLQELPQLKEYQQVCQAFQEIEGILVYKEQIHPSTQQYEYFAMEVQSRLSVSENRCLIVDIQETQIRDARSRSKLRSELEHLSVVVSHYAVVVGTDVQLQIAAKFIYQSLDVDFTFSTHKSIEGAVQYCLSLQS